MTDVTALGEILIDFTPKGERLFEANAGGAPCNVLAELSRLSKSTSFIGKIGTDMFGRFLKNTLDEYGINTGGVKETDDYFTTLAFVSLGADGNRDFSFARKFSADIMLNKDEIDESIILNSRIFHCGTLSMTDKTSREAQLFALDTAKSRDVVISVDPNLRLPLWKSEEDAKKAIDTVFRYADIIKISDYEIEFLCGKKDVLKGAMELFEKYSPKILFATCGENGAYLIKDDIVLHQPCFSVKAVDTTGAGDCFMGAALSKLLDYELDFGAVQYNKCREILRYASAAAGLATQKYGAMASMPNEKEIDELINGGNDNEK